MGKCRFVSPETTRIELSEGDWIEVKQRLSIGELNRATEMRERGDGDAAFVAIFLVDWSLTDQSGKVVPISGATLSTIVSAVNNLTTTDFQEINFALGKHWESVREADEARKKDQGGTTSSSTSAPSSPSVEP